MLIYHRKCYVLELSRENKSEVKKENLLELDVDYILIIYYVIPL